MTLLIGAITSICLSMLKKISKAIGMEMTKNIVLISLFVVSLITAFLMQSGIISKELIITMTQIISSAIAYYEIIVKRIIDPIFEKFN